MVYYILPDAKFYKKQGKSYLVDIPLTKSNNRKSSPITYIKKFIPISVSGFVMGDTDFQFAIQDWYYVKLEHSWWENSKIDKNKYALQLYNGTHSYAGFTSKDRDAYYENMNTAYNRLIPAIQSVLPNEINADSIVKKITKSSNFNVFNVSFIVTFKNNQQAIFKSLESHGYYNWNVTINNKTVQINDAKFKTFLLALSGTLENTIKKGINDLKKNPKLPTSNAFSDLSRQRVEIEKMITYLEKIDKTKAKDYLKQLKDKYNEVLFSRT